MAGTTISNSRTVGVTLTATSQDPVTVTSTGTITVSGSYASAIYASPGIKGTVDNSGVLAAANGYGIELHAGGTVTNGSATDTTASISGGLYGVRFDIQGSGKLTNFGTVANTGATKGAGVIATGAATVVNGSAADHAAAISGYLDGVRIDAKGTVTNFGHVTASSASGAGVYLDSGGTVTNGTASDTAATIAGGEFGVQIRHAGGTVTNLGTIKGIGADGKGVVLDEGGKIFNGNTADTTALISASHGDAVYIGGTAVGTVVNLGTIEGLGPFASGSGVFIRSTGTVTNGSAADRTAAIVAGRNGVYLRGGNASLVNNSGTITAGRDGVILYLGGTVINGSTADTAARISGQHLGVYEGGKGTVTNFGTIAGAGAAAVDLGAGGHVTNGTALDHAALISGGAGHTGVYVHTGSAAVTNFGTIAGTIGVDFTNGTLSATGTVVNAGSIISAAGTAGIAVLFGAKNDRLVDDPGSVLVGRVMGGAGQDVVELAAGGGIGTIAGSSIVQFEAMTIDSTASWNITGSLAMPAVTNNGTLTVAGGAHLHVSTAIDATSTGVFKLNASSLLEVLADTGAANRMQFLGGGELLIDNHASFGTNSGTASYTGPLIENFGTGDMIDLKDVKAAGIVLNYSTTTGLMQVLFNGNDRASLQFENTSLASGRFFAGSDSSGHLLITRG